MVMRAITKAIAPLRRRVQLMIGRAVIAATREDGGLLLAQITGLDGEVLDGVPVIQEYGFASRPKAGAQGVIACVGGNRRGAVVIATGDRRYRLALANGEVAIHDDQGQKVHLARGGIAVETTKPVTVKGSAITLQAASITLDGDVAITGTLDITGIVTAAAALTAASVSAAGAITAQTGGAALTMTGLKASIDAFKGVYNGHDHPGDSGGTTGAPNQGA